MKKYKFPIKMKFGLEVCYSPEHEEQIKLWKERLPLDFMVGAVHFIDGWAFGHKMQKWKCEDYDMNKIYKQMRSSDNLTEEQKQELDNFINHLKDVIDGEKNNTEHKDDKDDNDKNE